MSGKQQTPRDMRDIESALDKNRTNIDHTLDRLGQKFSPGELFDQAWRYARSKNADGTTSRLKETIVRNPLPIVLLGVGLAWLALAGRDGSVPEASRARRESEPATGGDRSASAVSPSAPPPPTQPRPTAATEASLPAKRSSSTATRSPTAGISGTADAAAISGARDKRPSSHVSADQSSEERGRVPVPAPSTSNRPPPAAAPRTTSSSAASSPAPATPGNRQNASKKSPGPL